MKASHCDALFDMAQSLRYVRELYGRRDVVRAWDSRRRVLRVSDMAGRHIVDFRPPLPIARPEDLLNDDAPEDFVPEPYILLLIQAGHAALALCEDGEIVERKVIRKYMVRKQQGRAQISFLNTKGKSRAGSRIRLAQSVQFFEEINTVLEEWFETEEITSILYSCPVRLWGILFQARVAAPFGKDDARLCKIPLDVHSPNAEELQRVNHFILQGCERRPDSDGVSP